MATERISLDEIYANEKCEGSVFRAVKMMSEEARFINEQANMGFIELSKKLIFGDTTSFSFRGFDISGLFVEADISAVNLFTGASKRISFMPASTCHFSN